MNWKLAILPGLLMFSEDLIHSVNRKLRIRGLLTDKEDSLDPTGLFENWLIWAEEKVHHAFKQSQ